MPVYFDSMPALHTRPINSSPLPPRLPISPRGESLFRVSSSTLLGSSFRKRSLSAALSSVTHRPSPHAPIFLFASISLYFSPHGSSTAHWTLPYFSLFFLSRSPIGRSPLIVQFPSPLPGVGIVITLHISLPLVLSLFHSGQSTACALTLSLPTRPLMSAHLSHPVCPSHILGGRIQLLHLHIHIRIYNLVLYVFIFLPNGQVVTNSIYTMSPQINCTSSNS